MPQRGTLALKAWILIGPVLPALLGCQTPGETTSVAQSSIVDGYPSPQADDGVVQLKTEVGLCTGALVAPNLVLTAQRCLVRTSPGLIDCSIDGIAGDTNGLILAPLDPSKIEVRVGVRPVATETPAAFGAVIVRNEQATSVCQSDIGLVVLDRKLEELPVLPLRLLRPTSVGEAISVVGYGDTIQSRVPDGNNGEAAVSTRRRRDDLTVLDVGGEGSAAALGTFLLGTSICSGDVGSPALSVSGAAVVGIASLVGESPCEASTRNIFTRVASYREVVVSAFESAGATPWLEGEPAPMQVDPPDSSGCAIARNAVVRVAPENGEAALVAILALVICWRLREARVMMVSNGRAEKR